MSKEILQTLLKESKGDRGIIFNSEGIVIDSLNMSKENNIAAMANVIITMASEFFQDTLESDTLNQIVLTSPKGLAVMNKYDNDHIVCLLAKDTSKEAIMKLTLKKITPQ